jgi:hypothetical protein
MSRSISFPDLGRRIPPEYNPAELKADRPKPGGEFWDNEAARRAQRPKPGQEVVKLSELTGREAMRVFIGRRM